MNELTIHSGGGSKRIVRDVTTTLLPAAEATLLSVQFRPELACRRPSSDDVAPDAAIASEGQAEQAKAVQWIVKRHHRAEGLKTEMQLRTGSVPCSLRLAAGVTSWVGQLGAQAMFTGTLDLELRSEPGVRCSPMEVCRNSNSAVDRRI